MVILSVEVRNGTPSFCHCICVAGGKLPSMVQLRDISSPSVSSVSDTATTLASGTTKTRRLAEEEIEPYGDVAVQVNTPWSTISTEDIPRVEICLREFSWTVSMVILELLK